MALASSGTLSIGGSTAGRSINLELSRSATATSSLGETALRDLAGVSSGAISMSNFHGKSSLPTGGSDIITGIGTHGSTQTLTFASATNLNLASSGNALTMIDINGNNASYTPITQTIANAAENTLTETWSNYGNGNFYPGYHQNNAFDGDITNAGGTALCLPSQSVSWIWNYSAGIPFDVTKMKLYGAKYLPNSCAIKINGHCVTNVSSMAHWGTGQAGITPNMASSPVIILYTLELIPWSVGPALGGVSRDGQLLIDGVPFFINNELTLPSGNNDIKYFVVGETLPNGGTIASKDEANNKLYVNGGAFQGSNGTQCGHAGIYTGNGGITTTQNNFVFYDSSDPNNTQDILYFDYNFYQFPDPANPGAFDRIVSQGTSSGWAISTGKGNAKATDQTLGLMYMEYLQGGSDGINVPSNQPLWTKTARQSVEFKVWYSKGACYFANVEIRNQSGTLLGKYAGCVNPTAIASASGVLTFGSNTAFYVDNVRVQKKGSSTISNWTLSSGTAQTYQTVVTGGAKSGTGNFSSTSSNTATITNSNSQWISNDNRQGSEYYVKLV